MIHVGDSREVLATLPESSIDAVVCDPPYELGFMGKAWDSSGIAYSVELWRAVLRVLKPGGHLIAFGGTRTVHRIACAIEDSGFEIRDMLQWLYGQGFPKSLDVGKAIDVKRDDEAEVRRVCRYLRAAMVANGKTASEIAAAFGFGASMVGHWTAQDSYSQPECPRVEQWQKLKALIGMGDDLDGVVERLNARKGTPSDAYKAAPIVGEHDSASAPGLPGLRFDVRDTSIRQRSAEAARWQGFGTALKPACEPIVLARRPLDGTVAANVLAHGTGALNVDGCRIQHAGEADLATSLAKNPGRVDLVTSSVYGRGRPQQSVNLAGRWPSNVLLDEVAAAEIDRQDKGASRFFYVAKPAGRERDAGLDAFESVAAHDLVDREAGSAGMQSPRAGAGRTSTERRNHHATVKPVDLMRYLCRLVTPPGGRVLDPFAGSGTTGIAAKLEGFDFVGVELLPEHAELARARIAATSIYVDRRTDRVEVAQPANAAQSSLFEVDP